MTLSTRTQPTTMTKLSSDFRCHGALPRNKTDALLSDECPASISGDLIFPRPSAALELSNDV